MDNKNKLVWIEHFTVQASDTDCRSRAKLSFILEIMQRTADSAVNSLGLSLERMLEAEMGWMMITLDLEFHRYPQLNDQLTVHTWSKGTKGVLWQRDYRIFDIEGIEIASARTTWALVDIIKRKLLRPAALPIEVIHFTGDSVGELPEKVSAPKELSMVEAYRYQVRYSGLDTNNHLNNARYGDICCDVLSPEEWETRDLKRFRITYMQEAKFGDELGIQQSTVNRGNVWVQGESSAAVMCFAACLEFGEY
ncbi:acyl-ACP thioesterase domain-containing protein [Paenibacillus sp. MMS20-IR301]|uniref:acyl-[acyl-carrier-protein] thioesterase n=1 Tax=Paenibacillus sp. MMS20-IR301 TaxID=2895946 RepID=UPI0028EAFBD1|nr:acyl-ACP thioesterase domain-containing protein [Paenibacillus sp. MMS20-IR301]WNS41623.1 thioesterase [Paenibacillus sp. MMS20-IR301]